MAVLNPAPATPVPPSAAPGTPQTATKAHVAGASAGIAALVASYAVPYASQYVDPAWAARCLDATGISALAAVPVAALAAGGTWWATYQARNKPKAE